MTNKLLLASILLSACTASPMETPTCASLGAAADALLACDLAGDCSYNGQKCDDMDYFDCKVEYTCDGQTGTQNDPGLERSAAAHYLGTQGATCAQLEQEFCPSANWSCAVTCQAAE
jgi:hypothetical protein